MPTIGEMKAHILTKAAEDESFRAQLLKDPRSTVSAELDIFIPEQFIIQVHEDSATTAHLVLPLSDRLTEEELATAAGGLDVYPI